MPGVGGGGSRPAPSCPRRWRRRWRMSARRAGWRCSTCGSGRSAAKSAPAALAGLGCGGASLVGGADSMDLDPVLLSRIAVRLGHRLAHPHAGVHRRAGLLHRGAGGAAPRHRPRDLFPDLDLLDEDLLRLLRHGRRLRHRHAVPVRHQLEHASPTPPPTCSRRCSPTRA